MNKMHSMCATVGALIMLSGAAQAGGADDLDWTGFHAGVSFGMASANTTADPATPLPGFESLAGNSQAGNSFTLGGNVGYDKQINSLVVGAFGELNYLHIATQGGFSEDGGPNPMPWGTEVGDLLGSARVKLGAASGNFMIYGSGGVAFAHSGVTGWNYEGYGAMDFPNNGLGTVFGAGVEFRVNPKVSLNFDFSHYNFSASNNQQEFTDENEGPALGGTNRTGIDVLKLGINYHF
ncbi:MAG: outer membrane beta-barrel protein [Alphaproteobacteria bacterium]|nr:outer membrane beta-barrel protein [Alphaproteobacteria bacterium]